MALPGLQVLQRTVCRCSTLPEKVQTLRANIHPEKDRTENKSSSVTYLLSFCEWPVHSKLKVLAARFFGTSWTRARQAPLSVGFSRQEYWSGLPFPSPGNLFINMGYILYFKKKYYYSLRHKAHRIKDLSSLTKDWNSAPCNGSTES